jgi:hypothetical protein
MVAVYRLETVGGTGVYGTPASNHLDFDPFRHPMPSDDSLLMQSLKMRNLKFQGYGSLEIHFGFSSLEQLRSWFYNDDWIRNISNEGIVLSIYEAEDVYFGNSQLCFNRSSAVLKSQNNLVEFFKLR